MVEQHKTCVERGFDPLWRKLIMKYLKLTIVLEEGHSKADLANIFGEPLEINLTFKYLQFSFQEVKMLTAIQLTPIYNLIASYEKQYGRKLLFKMFHLEDTSEQLFSPISIQCFRGESWAIISSTTDKELASSSNLLTLI